MKELIKVLFQKRDTSTYKDALEKLSNVRKLLEQKPKSIVYKEVYITEIKF